jgi:hypothetical protein
VIYLLSREDYVISCADVITDYISTEGQCVTVHYQWLPRGHLSVIVRSENHDEIVVKVISSDDQHAAPPGTWLMLLARLPSLPGLQQVIVRARRPAGIGNTRVVSGVVLDDLTVQPCSDLGIPLL